ncbi:hypothetical protein BC826DRAFT_1107518 [Russula brevipes]|nr:hypothetical protein BC826DRAFT_1107518 [Russula brevipes]
MPFIMRRIWTGSRAMPLPGSPHAPYYSGESGELLEAFLLKFEELADDYCLTDQEKVESILKYMNAVDHRLKENFYVLKDLIRTLRSLTVCDPLYADLYRLLMQFCPSAATGLRIPEPERASFMIQPATQPVALPHPVVTSQPPIVSPPVATSLPAAVAPQSAVITQPTATTLPRSPQCAVVPVQSSVVSATAISPPAVSSPTAVLATSSSAAAVSAVSATVVSPSAVPPAAAANTSLPVLPPASAVASPPVAPQPTVTAQTSPSDSSTQSSTGFCVAAQPGVHSKTRALEQWSHRLTRRWEQAKLASALAKRCPTATNNAAKSSPQRYPEAAVAVVSPSSPFDTLPPFMPRSALLKPPPEPPPLPATSMPPPPSLSHPPPARFLPQGAPFAPSPLCKAQSTIPANILAPLHRDTLPPVIPQPPLSPVMPASSLSNPPLHPPTPPLQSLQSCQLDIPPEPPPPRPEQLRAACRHLNGPQCSRHYKNRRREFSQRRTRSTAAHKSNAASTQASNIPDLPPVNSSTLQDLGTHKTKTATPSTPAPQHLNTTTPQAQEVINAPACAAAADINITNRLHRRPQQQRLQPQKPCRLRCHRLTLQQRHSQQFQQLTEDGQYLDPRAGPRPVPTPRPTPPWPAYKHIGTTNHLKQLNPSSSRAAPQSDSPLVSRAPTPAPEKDEDDPMPGGGGNGDDFGAWATNAPPTLWPPEKDNDNPMSSVPPPIGPLDCARRPSTYEWRRWWRRWRRLRPPEKDDNLMPSVPPPIRSLDHTRHPSTYEWRGGGGATATTSVRGRRTHLHHSGPLKKMTTTRCRPFPHRSNPLTARAARPPTSGGGGGSDGDDFGAWATNAPPPLGPPEKDDDDLMPSVPPPMDPSTAHAACPPTSGGGGNSDGDDFGVWATNVPPTLWPPEKDDDDPMPSVPPPI